jgi:hypothetical protein
MKYISKTHLILLAIIVVILGGMLLLGEHFANLKPIRSTSDPVGPVTSNDQESLLYGVGNPQSQLEELRSQSFIVRPGQNKLTYSDALSLYKNNLLQFDENCQLSSKDRSFNLNNEVMIDNKSSKPNTFTVGNESVIVGPYDFRFMILRESGTNISVSCDDRKNVAVLTVQ